MSDYDTAVATPGFFHVIWSDNRDDLPGGAPRKDPNVYYEKIPLGLAVTTTDPAVGSIITTQPTNFTVNVTDPVDATTLQASDFTVNGIPADLVTYTPGDTAIFFTFNTTPVTSEGLQTMHVAAGAFTRDPDGSPVVEFTGTFRYDTLQLQVISTSPPFPGGVFTLPGPFTYDVTFNEPISPASVQTGDLTLSGIPGATVSGVTVLPGDLTAQFTLSGITTEGTLTASISGGAITDAFGNPGAPFSAPYVVDIGTVAYPTPLLSKDPRGSLIYDPSIGGNIGFAGDTDSFILSVDPGQTITALVSPSVAGLRPAIVVRDPSNSVVASATAGAAGQNALVQTLAANPAGTYTFEVSGASGTTGDYQLQVILNAALETEGTLAGVDNNTVGTAQNLDASFTTHQTVLATAQRGAALGMSDSANYSASAVPFAFEDISGTGTAILTNVDDAAASVPIGFTFPFYGTNNTTVFVSSNGLMTFGSSSTAFTNSDLTTSPTQASIAPFWDDQHTGGGQPASNVFFQTLGSGSSQRLVVQWNQVRFFSGGTAGDTITYQAVLFADGSVRFNYLDLVSGTAAGNNGGSATVGLKAAGTQGPNRLLLAFNNGPNAFVGTGQSTLISPPSPTPDYYSFSASAGDIVTIGTKALGIGTVNVDLRDAGDVVLATGAGGSTNLDSVINNFVAPASGTYYARVSSTVGVNYSLVVTLDASFDTEQNDPFATAQPLGGNRATLGGISTAGAYMASTEPFGFEDISGTGTVIAGLTNADDAAVSIPIGFSFPFYGTSNTSLFVSSNGLITFGSAVTTFTNTDLTAAPTTATIAPFWDDQHTGGGAADSNVYFQVTGSGADQHLTIQWNKVRFFSGGTAGDTITYQAQLFADGRIRFNYQDLTSGAAAGNNGASATVGVKNAGTQGPDRLLLAFNNGPNAFVGTGLSTLVRQPASDDWYSITLGAGQTGLAFLTATPGDGPGEFVNVLDPHIELYDPANMQIATGVDTGDGRNETLISTGLTPGNTYRVRVTSEGNTSGEYFLTAKVLPVATTSAVTVTPNSVQYSDQVSLKATLSPTSFLGVAPATSVTFKVGSGMTQQTFGPVPLMVVGSQLEGTFTGAQILQAAGSYTVTAEFGGVSPVFTVNNPTTSLTVTKEDANVDLAPGYPYSVQVNTPGGTAGPITRCVDITEVADGSLGNINLAQPVTVSVTPVGPGSAPAQSAVSYQLMGTTLKACVTFTNVAVNVYDVTATIGGNFYQGSGSYVLVVFDPSLGFVTGGGTFVNPNTGNRVNYGLSAKYQKNGQSKGSVLYLEHTPTGVVKYKGNVVQSLSIVGTTAIITGKGVFNDVGNYGFRLTVVDNGEPGTGDQAGFQLTVPGGAIVPNYTFAPVTLTGGNNQVPH